jgi:hypothetical protein
MIGQKEDIYREDNSECENLPLANKSLADRCNETPNSKMVKANDMKSVRIKTGLVILAL